MRKFLLFLLVLGVFQTGFGQFKKKEQPVTIVSHQVQFGETVKTISKKYLADPSEIYRINKFAVEGVKEGMVLQIPVPIKNSPKAKPVVEEQQEQVAENSETNVTVIDRNVQIEHLVQSGETLSGLSKKYGISIDEIKMSNETLQSKGLKVGQTIKIPSTRTLDANEASIGSDVTPVSEVASSSKTKNKK